MDIERLIEERANAGDTTAMLAWAVLQLAAAVKATKTTKPRKPEPERPLPQIG
jgi:hypothetical protein